MKLPFIIDAKGKLVETDEHWIARCRAKAIERAILILKYGKPGIDYYV